MSTPFYAKECQGAQGKGGRGASNREGTRLLGPVGLVRREKAIRPGNALLQPR